MKITFYGVRGSIASPGESTAKYGGNTSCVHIELKDGQRIVLDAGTGIRKLGEKLIHEPGPINIMLSHGHWDHIQGYPFFAPIFQPERQIIVFTSDEGGHQLMCTLFDQMDGSNFPLKAEELPSNSECIFKGASTVLYEKNINVAKKGLNHPGGGSGYRIEDEGVSCAYITDNELEPPNKPNTTYDEWVDFCTGVDVLIHDAQYIEEDLPHKHGWGHSVISQVRQLAIDAKVGKLILFHHDPDRTDSELDEIQIENEKFFQVNYNKEKSYCAAEGMEITLAKRSDGSTQFSIN